MLPCKFMRALRKFKTFDNVKKASHVPYLFADNTSRNFTGEIVGILRKTNLNETFLLRVICFGNRNYY